MSGSSSIVWCDPPPDGWAGLLQQVMERPGEWALVRTYDRRSAARDACHYLRYKPQAAVPEGQWEFVVRSMWPGFGLWARWLG